MKKHLILSIILLSCLNLIAGSAAAYQPFAQPSNPPDQPQPNPENQAELSLNPEQFPLPAGVNPITGNAVKDPTLLNLSPVLVSISNFPGATRPQMGLSFAAQVYEFWIGVGMTRFLTIYYGEFPHYMPSMIGDCAVRWESFQEPEPWIGNFVWFDENNNGIQDTGERGVPGVCLQLLDAESQSILATTTTDSNGYYGFHLNPKQNVILKVNLPLGTKFSPLHQGDQSRDSDIDPQSGQSAIVTSQQINRDLDVGLIWDRDLLKSKSNRGKTIHRTVFLDSNHNGLKDEGEAGIPNIQVNLVNMGTGHIEAKTLSDENGEYSFNIKEDQPYYIHLLPDLGSSFTLSKDQLPAVDNTPNSYEEPIHGRSPVFTAATYDNLAWDIGIKPPQAGPLRSGRIIYQTLGQYFQGARLFYASKHSSVEIGGAGNVYSEDPQSISSAFLNVDRMIKAAAETSQSEKPYASNMFSAAPPPSDINVHSIHYFVNVLNASQWQYDPLSETYLRYDDHSDGRGFLYPSIDRLTGRQLQYSNIIIVFTKHTHIEGLKIEMNIHPNTKNNALLLRDGKAYPVFWSTLNESYEKRTQRLRPPRIVDTEGKVFPLKPGKTWFILVTERTTIEKLTADTLRIRFFEPPIKGTFIK